jgi:peptide/nickel transport system substrate-binding protein
MSCTLRLACTVLASLAVLVSACAPTAPTTAERAAAPAPQVAKIARFAMMGEIKGSLVEGFMDARQIRGRETVSNMLGTSLTAIDPQGTEIPMIAEQFPTLENGLWKIFPDGSMETTYRLRRDVTWHDGTPVTAPDFVLAGQVVLDPNLAGDPKPWGRAVESFSAPDAQTVTVRWRSPFINANTIFSSGLSGTGSVLPLPGHLVADAYASSPSTFFEHRYFTHSFVGTGPFKLESFEPSSQITLTAFDGYFLGRPKLDRIEIRMFLDANALVANILAGAVEMTLDNSLTVDQAVQVRERWTQGTINFRAESNGVPLWINLQNPDPAAIGDVRFRKALYHAMDRQSMVDTMQHGMSSVVDHYLSVTDPDHQATRSKVVAYDYDPRKTAQILQTIGFSKGGDGYYRDASGRPLTEMELRSTATDELQLNVGLVTASSWESAGLKAAVLPAPEQLRQDREWRNTFPAFEVSRKGQTALDMVQQMHSRQVPTSANNWSGNNRSRLSDPQLDALFDRYVVTIPQAERRAIATDIFGIMTDNVYLMPTFFFQYPVMVSHQLRNVAWKETERHTTYLWDKAGG